MNRKQHQEAVSILFELAEKAEIQKQQKHQFDPESSPADNFISCCEETGVDFLHKVMADKFMDSAEKINRLLKGSSPGNTPAKYDKPIIEAINTLKLIWGYVNEGYMDRFEKHEPIQNQYGTIELKYAPLGCPGDYVVSDHHGILENGDMHAQAESEEQLPYTEPDLFAFFVDMLTGKTLAESIKDDIMANQKVLITCSDPQYINILQQLIWKYISELFKDLVIPESIWLTGGIMSGIYTTRVSGKNSSQFKIGDGSCSWLEATRHYRQIALES